jgi:hypothetical protein
MGGGSQLTLLRPSALATTATQVYLGQHIFRSSTPCLVVCQGWPSLLPLLPTLHLHCLSLLTNSNLGLLLQGWQEFRSIETRTLQELGEYTYALTPSMVLCVQGLPGLWTALPQPWRHHPRTVCFFDRVCSIAALLRALVYQHWSHAAVGGISDGTWSVGSHHPLPVCDASIPPRSVRHVIDPKIVGRGCTAASQQALPATARVPTENALTMFHLPSVFSPLGTLRSLTLCELGQAFDVPTVFLPHLTLHNIPMCTQACPGKIIRFVGEAILYSSGGLLADGRVLGTKEAAQVPVAPFREPLFTVPDVLATCDAATPAAVGDKANRGQLTAPASSSGHHNLDGDNQQEETAVPVAPSRKSLFTASDFPATCDAATPAAVGDKANRGQLTDEEN